MEAHRSKARVRFVVGLLDLILTVAIIAQVICFTITPLLQEKLKSRFKSGQGTANPHQDGELSDKWWMWPFLGVCTVCAMIPVLAAIALLISTSSSICFERAQAMTRFWMYSNSFTIVITTIELLGAFLLDLLVVRVGYHTPTLVYLCFRGAFTFIIWKQLDTLSPVDRPTLDDDLLDEKRTRYREISKISVLERRSQSDFNDPRTFIPPEIPPSGYAMQAYHGNNSHGNHHSHERGLSMPNCRCCTTQNCYN